MYRYSMTQWIVGDEEIEYSFQRLKKYGYDGIEFAAEPALLDADRLNELMKQYGISCTSLCGIFPEERDLSSGDPGIAGAAVQYLKDSVDFAVAVGAPYIIVVPSPVGRIKPLDACPYEEAWKNAVNHIRTAADYAREKGVRFAIEAVNRYETYLVNHLTGALAFVKEINHPAVGLMADLFHMSLEERSISDSLCMISDYLMHVHVADNTREAAGLGSTDFKTVLRTLDRIGYQGPLTMEFLPRIADPYAASDMGTHAKLMDLYAAQAINYMKILENSVE